MKAEATKAKTKSKKRVRFNIIESETEDLKESTKKMLKARGYYGKQDAKDRTENGSNSSKAGEMPSKRRRTQVKYNENNLMRRVFDEDETTS